MWYDFVKFKEIEFFFIFVIYLYKFIGFYVKKGVLLFFLIVVKFVFLLKGGKIF